MKSNLKNIIIISFIALVNLSSLLFIKYYQNNFSLSEFGFNKIGNFLNIFLTILFLLGIFLLFKQKANLTSIRAKALITFSILYLVPIFIILFFNFVDFKFEDEFFLGYPLKKIIPVIFFTVNQSIFLFVLFLIWFMYLGYSLLGYFYSTLAVIVTILVLMLFTFFYTFFTNEYNLDRNGKKFDYGIILGAAVWSGNKPSPIFMGRIDKGAELLKNKVIGKIQLTGGNAPGELSEAEAALKYLQAKHKLSTKNIEVENLTSTTNEQIKFVKNNLENGDKSKKFIIISDEFHLKRVEEMVDFYNLNAEVISSNYKLNFQKSFYYRLRDSIGLIIFWFFGL